MTNAPLRPRILRLGEIKTITGLSRSTIYEHMNAGKFPKPVKLGTHSVGWIESEIYGWVDDLMLAREIAALDKVEPSSNLATTQS